MEAAPVSKHVKNYPVEESYFENQKCNGAAERIATSVMLDKSFSLSEPRLILL